MSKFTADQSFDHLFKIVIVGDSRVGKTNIMSMFIMNEFDSDSKSTIGVEFGNKMVNFEDYKIKLQIWDTSGQQRFRAITAAYYRGAAMALIVFDLTQRSTYNNASKWLKQVKCNAAQNVVIILIGNKSDLTQKRQIRLQEIQKFAEQNDLTYVQISAKQNINVEQAFQVRELLPQTKKAEKKCIVVKKENKESYEKEVKQPMILKENPSKPIIRVQEQKPKVQPNFEGAAFFDHLKSKDIKDQVITILCSQQITSLEVLRECNQEALLSIGIKLGQIIKLKKL